MSNQASSPSELFVPFSSIVAPIVDGQVPSGLDTTSELVADVQGKTIDQLEAFFKQALTGVKAWSQSTPFRPGRLGPTLGAQSGSGSGGSPGQSSPASPPTKTPASAGH